MAGDASNQSCALVFLKTVPTNSSRCTPYSSYNPHTYLEQPWTPLRENRQHTEEILPKQRKDNGAIGCLAGQEFRARNLFPGHGSAE